MIVPPPTSQLMYPVHPIIVQLIVWGLEARAKLAIKTDKLTIRIKETQMTRRFNIFIQPPFDGYSLGRS